MGPPRRVPLAQHPHQGALTTAGRRMPRLDGDVSWRASRAAASPSSVTSWRALVAAHGGFSLEISDVGQVGW